MAKIRFDARTAKPLARARAGISQHAGAQVLLLAAEYLWARKPLPDALADHLAAAFVSAARHRPRDQRGMHLARKLHLAPPAHRPKKGYWLDIGEAMDQMMSAGMSQDKAAGAFLDGLKTAGPYSPYSETKLVRYGLKFDKHTNEIDTDTQTIIRRWEEYKKAQKAHREATRED